MDRLDLSMMSDLGESVVLVSESDASNLEETPSKTMSASKRKRDEMQEVDSENGSGDSDSFIKMERMSPEPRRKNPNDATPEKSKTEEQELPLVLNMSNIDENLPEQASLLHASNGAKVYVVGTAHFSKKSIEDVSTVIQAVRPHIIVVELCSSRTDFLLSDEETLLNAAKDLSVAKILQIIKASGPVQGLVHVALLSMSAQITKQLGMAPGGEFRRAFIEAQRLPGCIVSFGDRPIGVTMARLLSGLSVWQSLKIVWNIIANDDLIKPEDIEKTKKKDFIETMMAELGQDFPIVKDVLVSERDKYLAGSLHIAAESRLPYGNTESPRIVGVVGLGHVEGIKANWQQVSEEEMARISTVPPPSLSIRVCKWTFRCAFYAGAAYAAYKIAPPTYRGVSQLVNWTIQPIQSLPRTFSLPAFRFTSLVRK